MQSIDIPNVIIGVFTLIFVLLGFALVVLGFFSLVFRLGRIFYKWLSQRAFCIRLHQRLQEWWGRHKLQATWWWESTAIVLIDPVFYGYALVTLLQRLQAIQEYAQVYPQYSFGQLLDLDMTTHMQYYIALGIIFLLWMAWKVQRHAQEVRFERNVTAKLDKLRDSNKALNEEIRDNTKQISEDMRQLTKSINNLVEEIRKGKEDKHGKSPSDM
jgi:hypothetical protein